MFARLKLWAVPAVLAVMTAGLAACEPPRNAQATMDGSLMTITWDAPDCQADNSCDAYLFDQVLFLNVSPGVPGDFEEGPCGVPVGLPRTCSFYPNLLPAGDYVSAVVSAYDGDGFDNDPDLVVDQFLACVVPLDQRAFDSAIADDYNYSGGFSLKRPGCTVGSLTFVSQFHVDGPPSAPTDVTAVAGNAQASVSWSAPSDDGGSAITAYTVTANPGGKTCDTTGELSCTVTGLDNGTEYSFTVTARNASQDSVPSASVSATPVTVADAPTGVSAVAGDGQATVSWSAPAFDGGSAITAYTVTASTGETCQTAIGVSLDFTSCTVEGLPNLQWLTFTVVATNAAGDSVASDATDRFVLHTDEFQVWLPDATVARDADAQVFVFGAMGVDTVKVRIGREVFEATPDEFGTAVVDYNAGESNLALAYGKVRVTATGVRVEDGSKEKLRATAMFFAPKTTVRSRVRAGGQAVVRVRAANPGSSFSFRIDGVEVCTADADERGWVVCSFDAPEAGDYTVETFVGDLLTGSNDFTVLTGRRATT